ncbi:hypothetical protein [Ahrensia kielensis]|uniref:hypothetical protein n=1 Tax=Ahrensia kielensis TaxID=76980 RepID=UPI00037E182C|nr:hypothetical protein [Ahrensia kielensis]
MTLEFKHNTTAHKAPSKTKLGYASRFLTGVANAAEIRISKLNLKLCSHYQWKSANNL